MMMMMIFNSIKILNADKCKDDLYKTVKILEVEFASEDYGVFKFSAMSYSALCRYRFVRCLRVRCARTVLCDVL